MKEDIDFEVLKRRFDKISDPDRKALAYHLVALTDLYNKCFPGNEERVYAAFEVLFPGVSDIEVPDNW